MKKLITTAAAAVMLGGVALAQGSVQIMTSVPGPKRDGQRLV